MARFECKKCGSLVVIEKGSRTATCNICGKKQSVPARVIDDEPAATRNDFDPQWNHYAQLLHKARTYRDIRVLTETAKEFDRLGEYGNSREMAEYCRKKAADEQSKRNSEAQTRDIDSKRKKKGTAKYHIKMALLNIGVVAIVIVITLLSNEFIKRPSYDMAQTLISEGQYEEAIYYLKRLGRYQDSEELLEMCENSILESFYLDAVAQMEKGHYVFALEKFRELNGFKDSETMILECRYRYGLDFMEKENYYRAMKEFLAIAEYKDAAAQAEIAKSKLPSSKD